MSSVLALQRTRALIAPPVSQLVPAYLAIAFVIIALPALLLPMPPLLDYPNHYVRIWLLAGGMKHGPLAHMYAVDWRSAWTNIGIDVAAQALGTIIPGRALPPLFLAAALVMPPMGAVMLHRRLFGGWRWWQVALPLAAWSTTLLAGFLNYQIGLGCALMAAAADPWLQKRATPIQLLIARIVIATALLVVHIFALGFYAALLGGLAVGPSLKAVFDKRDAFRGVVLKVVAVAGAIAVPLIAYRLTAAKLPGGGALAPDWGPLTFEYKRDVLLCAFGTYDLTLDGLFFGATAAMVLVALFKRNLQAHQGLLLSALGLVVIAMLAPQWAADTAWVDTRIPIMALLTLMAAVNPAPEASPKLGFAGATLLLALVLGRAGWIDEIWNLRQADYRSIDLALSRVPAGASVMPLEHWPSIRGKKNTPIGRYFHYGASFYHDYTLPVVERGAFSPLVFAAPGKQPLRVLEPYTDLSVPNGGRSPPLWALTKPTRKWLKVAPYLSQWRQRFDYALMLNADVLEPVDNEPLPDGLKLVADEGFARLYQIDRIPAPGAAPAVVPPPAALVPAKAATSAPRTGGPKI